jgi:hypothetical protein
VTVGDVAGGSADASVAWIVNASSTPPQPPGNMSGAGGLSPEEWGLVLGAVVILAVGLVVGLWWTRRRPPADPVDAPSDTETAGPTFDGGEGPPPEAGPP